MALELGDCLLELTGPETPNGFGMIGTDIVSHCSGRKTRKIYDGTERFEEAPLI